MKTLKILYATGNQGKTNYMKEALTGLPIELLTLDAFSAVKEKTAPEDGDSALENAVKKAEFYYRELSVPLFSCDTALTIQNLPENLQPGVRVRRVGEKTLSDEEMIEYYTGLAKRYGRLRCRYRNAICIILDDRTKIVSDAPELSGESFTLLPEPARPYLPGFPLDAFTEEKNKKSDGALSNSQKGFRELFKHII